MSITSPWRREHTSLVSGKRLRFETIASPGSPIISWNGTERFRFWRGRLQFYIYVENSIPTEAQLALLVHVMTESKASRSEIESALLQYYERYVAPAYARQGQSSVMGLRRFRKSIGDPTVHIDTYSKSYNPAWTLGFAPDWDDEHEIRVHFKDDKIVDVSN